MIKHRNLKLITALLISVSALSACSSGNPADSTATKQISKDGVIENYTNIVSAGYQDSLMEAKKLQQAVNKFVAIPTQENHDAAKSAWLKARIPYGQTEAFRFYDGPIDREGGPEGQLNSWPLDEVYIDYVEGSETAGIINNPAQYPEISKTLLTDLNEKGGDKNISTGYHAVEFLLWGQDLTTGAGAGERKFTDYLTGGNGTHANQERRAKFLVTVTDLLVEDLQKVADAWEPDKTDNYRAEFKKMNIDEALTKVLRGSGTLSASELSNERMATPLDIGEREEEHSCFSDNTHTDILQNTRSIQNVLFGSYTRVDGSEVKGPSFYELLRLSKPELAEKLKNQSEAAFKLVSSIKGPFDQEIRPDNKEGNQRVKSAIDALGVQGITIVEAATALGLNVNTELE